MQECFSGSVKSYLMVADDFFTLNCTETGNYS